MWADPGMEVTLGRAAVFGGGQLLEDHLVEGH